MTSPLGKKVPQSAPSKPAEWVPHADKRFEVNRQGQLRTRIPPPDLVWPFPLKPKP